MNEAVSVALERLAALYGREREAARAAYRAARQQLSFPERVARGLALRGLTLEDADAAAGGRVLLWWKLERGANLGDARIRIGDPVLLWAGSPEGERTQAGVVARLARDKLAVAVDADYAEFLDDGACNLDREAPEATFVRGEQAIARFRTAASGGSIARLREVLFFERAPEFGPDRLREDAFLDPELDPSQREAVRFALRAEDIALIHGPPGTGKTRTLCEVVRQAVARGERVLVCAASNTAVDNLGERLSELAVPLVRLGHPARVSRALEARTLDALVEASEARARARRWIAEANEIRRRVERRRQRERLGYREAREQMAEARALLRDARRALEKERDAQLGRVQVICATAAGIDAAALAGADFDRLVLDEATQALDPVALAALARGQRVVMAGDPKQLPPTVIDPQAAAEGLASTFFERLAERHGEGVGRMLEVQYRMHETLMRFPSQSMYGGRLRAAPAVEKRRLDELPGVAADGLRPGPLHFIDCAGKGFAELRSEEDSSTSNPGQADRTAREVKRLLGRGLRASEVALITPYLAQVRALRERLREALDAGLEIDSVDGFQGREKEAVIVDLVRSNDDGAIGFLADTRRTHVAITRAKRFLIVLGDSATLAQHDYYRRLLDFAEQNGAYLSAWADDADAFE